MMYKLLEKNWKKIALVDLLTEPSKLFWVITEKTIQKYKKEWKKILFVTNRKWYASSSICEDCWYISKCNNCDIPIAKYKIPSKNEFIYMCPICRRVYENTWTCEKCAWTHLKEQWIWTYKLQEILKEKFNIDCFVVENTDVNSLNKIKKINLELKSKQFVISTSILSCETSLFQPDIVIFPNADTGLLLPDFNVAEKHFLFLNEFFKKYKTSNFIIQTFNIDHYVYQNLLDLEAFWKKELEYRKQLNYPPYTDLAVIMYKSEIEDRLYRKISKLESELKYLIEKEWQNIDIFPTPQLVYKKFWKYHYNIVLKWKNLKSFLDKAVVLLKLQQKWFQIDWLPVNII